MCMKRNLESGEYGSGSEALAAIYHDFLLVMDNCKLYNDEDSEVTEEAARIMGQIPEAFASACLAATGEEPKTKKKKKKKRG